MLSLKEQMIMDLELKGYSPKTQTAYLRYMKDFTHHLGKSPEKMDEKEIKEYLHFLITQKKASQSTINSAYSALKFFYETTLHRDWGILKIPRIKKSRQLPIILDRSEVKNLLAVTTNVKHRTILMTTYAAGLRVSETAHLRISDIDSKRMQIRVEQGKGKKDRYTLLSEINLNLLRSYWKIYQPRTWLFPGNPPENPISTRSIQHVLEKACQKAGIQKKICVHSLRHSFATHLLEAGTDIYYIQQLMGHASVKTTTIYIHLRNQDALKVISPLDLLFKPII
jgi:site-specific recombinase XerD